MKIFVHKEIIITFAYDRESPMIQYAQDLHLESTGEIFE